MANDINQVSTSSVSNPAIAGKTQATGLENTKGKDSADQAVATQSDTITITDSATKLAELEARLADMPIVDEQRVAQIKAAIADGTYQVNAESTATKLLQLEAELLK